MSTSRLPAWILFTPVDAVSVNHANVVPTSMTTHMTNAVTLVSSARFVALLLFIVCEPS